MQHANRLSPRKKTRRGHSGIRVHVLLRANLASDLGAQVGGHLAGFLVWRLAWEPYMGLLAAIGLHAHPGPLFAVQKADHLPDGGRKQRRNAAVELEARWGRLI